LHTAETDGFALPLIEATACGAVLASDLPVLGEVGGTAAAYAPVADAWNDAALRLRGDRPESRNTWALRCKQDIARASGFSWSEAARQTAAIYGSVLRLGTQRETIAT
jgi:glycosyltransferase involved in cell wall biosynthesis